ncbi:hypothetical protein IV72_GL000747 [Atopobium minutum]|nr:hypothetical protein IV72_GL000747 [Atopobium minutum]
MSKTGSTRWEKFPVGADGEKFDEVDFQNFVKEYLMSCAKSIGGRITAQHACHFGSDIFAKA